MLTWHINRLELNWIELFSCLLFQAFSAWYFFSWIIGDPHRSGFKFQTAILAVLWAMLQVQLSFVVSLLIVLLVRIPNFSVNFVAIPVAPIITGMTTHYIFQIIHDPSSNIHNIYSNNCIIIKRQFINIWHSYMFRSTLVNFREVVNKRKSSG
jgi:hypothetical protein